MRHCRHTAVIGAICLLLLPVAAHGQAGQRPDPDSPAGVEYQLPLDQARKNAAGGGAAEKSSADGGGSGTAPLFGAGIVAAKGSGAGEGGAGGSGDGGGPPSGEASAGGSAGSEAGGGDRAGDADKTGDGAIKQAALSSPDEDGGSAALRIAGIALTVLLVGGLLGFLLRRGLGQQDA